MNLKSFILTILTFVSIYAQSQNQISLQVESFKLENGFTVYLNPDSTSTKVFGAILVNAGSVHELPNATGMAHYLEHMLFKGTDMIGTRDYEKEKVHYDSIVQLYDQLERTCSELICTGPALQLLSVTGSFVLVIPFRLKLSLKVDLTVTFLR